MTDNRQLRFPADAKTRWFQKPLRDPTDLDGKISFAQPGLRGVARTNQRRREVTTPRPRCAGEAGTYR